MKKFLILLFLLFNYLIANSQPINPENSFIKICTTINPKAIEYGIQGFNKLTSLKKIGKNSKLIIIDYSKKSSVKRMVILDMENIKIIDSLWVAHGRESDPTHSGFPIYFSNEKGSKKSSKGFFKTDAQYIGKHGKSLKLIGLEEGINENSLDRAIVIHSAPYVSQEYISKFGVIGRSWGCPVIQINKIDKVINEIENGYCLFIYTNDASYLKESKIINE